jgi:KRAB domain-containing zinc finger protein
MKYKHRLHIRNLHMNDKRHICQVCDMRFVRAGDLRLHFYRLHSLPSDRPFPCDKCSKAFASKSEVARHMKTHSRRRRGGGSNTRGNDSSSNGDDDDDY